jgi:hypothetical protein
MYIANITSRTNTTRKTGVASRDLRPWRQLKAFSLAGKRWHQKRTAGT